jgi:tRNA-dihydrouridine synthase
MEIFNKYPIEELIIHPRIQKDYYKNKPNMEVFKFALNRSKNPVCYNGDIFTKEDYERFSAGYPDVETVMLGRGLLMNPGLVHELLYDIRFKKDLVKDFYEQIYRGYKGILFGGKDILFKMKELWSYMILAFPDSAKHLKRIKKSQSLHAYEEAVACLFSEPDIMGEK